MKQTLPFMSNVGGNGAPGTTSRSGMGDSCSFMITMNDGVDLFDSLLSLFLYFCSLKNRPMISYIKGRLVEKNPAYVVVETAGGIGFYINISLATFSKLKEESEEVKLLTHYIVKEDAQILYGFIDEEERELFKLLLTVNGIGPNTARLILSSMSVGEVLNAIATEDVKAIQSVKGIGAKTAQRVIIELKDKTKKTDWAAAPKISVTYNNNKYEALSALIALGFPKAGAESVLDKIIKAEGINLSVEELIKRSLKLL